MRIAIMQPYFLPYIGYFQLIAAVDEFVIYDNIKYTKKSWINRNRYLLNDKDELFSVPVKKGSDSLLVRDREVSEVFDRKKLLNQLATAYAKAPHVARVLKELEEIIGFQETSLFRFLLHSVRRICTYLDITTPLVVSSTIPIDHESLKAQDKVVAICRARQAAAYTNPIGGLELYDKAAFAAHGIALSFLKTGDVRYRQLGDAFVPSLSIIDVMMFNTPDECRTLLDSFSLV